MYDQTDYIPSEKELSADLEWRLGALSDADRCIFRKEVRMLCYTHSLRGQAQSLRVDYVAYLDGVLIGFEVKKPPEKAADLGRYLLQCAQYAQGVIAPATADRVPPAWVGKALFGVYLVSSSTGISKYVREHGLAAHRLFGPANVGFLKRECRHPDSFELFTSGERAWAKERGWHRGMMNKTTRSGNGSFHAAETEDAWSAWAPVESEDQE